MYQNFDVYFRHVLEYEGTGYEDVKGDNGGPTKCGITCFDVARFHGIKLPSDKVSELRGWSGFDNLVALTKEINPTTAGVIYKKFYWDDVKADDLPPGLDYAAVDFAVNSGTGESAKVLNGLLGIRQNIHTVSDQTVEAAKAYGDLTELIGAFQDARKAYLIAISTPPHFAHNVKFRRGWLEREAEVRAESLTLLKAQAPSMTVPVPGKIPRPTAPPPPPPPTPGKVAVKSRSGWAIIIGAGTYLTQTFTNGFHMAIDTVANWIGQVPAIKSDADGLITPITDTFSLLHHEVPAITTAVVITCLLVAYVRHIRDKTRLATLQQQVAA